MDGGLEGAVAEGSWGNEKSVLLFPAIINFSSDFLNQNLFQSQLNSISRTAKICPFSFFHGPADSMIAVTKKIKNISWATSYLVTFSVS